MSVSTTHLQEVGLNVSPLQNFLGNIKELTLSERKRLILQAMILIEDVYVHLPLKRAMHAVDPIHRLKLLKYRNPKLSDRSFHNEMISIFIGLRDLHTNYILPEPYQNMRAFLPFFIEECYEEGQKKYMVSKLSPDFFHANFKVGVYITHWNGIPIERAVELNGNRCAGSNEAAHMARGLDQLTIRPLEKQLPPDEEWVDIKYSYKNKSRRIQFKWKITPSPPQLAYIDKNDNDLIYSTTLGLDFESEAVRRMKKAVFASSAMKLEKKMENYSHNGNINNGFEADINKISLLPDNFAFRIIKTTYGEYGYIRIYTFEIKTDITMFLKEFIRILQLLPSTGLIIDVRGNSGGLITAGEKILQLLTPQKIQSQRFSFINSHLMLDLCKRYNWLSQWAPSIDRSIETGAVFSQGFPLESPEAYNGMGQKYFGPVILITDALSYSATDIFVAGFQDHEIGPILGIHKNTGAGGANVWKHQSLKKLLSGNPSIISLPRNSTFRIAIRRATRVGKNIGVPLEDLGVIPDFIYKMTPKDLFQKNTDLIHHAANILNTLKKRNLSRYTKWKRQYYI